MARRAGLAGGRQAKRQFEGRSWQQHVAGIDESGKAIGAGNAQGRPPRVVQHQFQRRFVRRRFRVEPGEPAPHRILENLRSQPCLLFALPGYVGVQFRHEYAAIRRVFHPAQQLAKYAEAGRYNAARASGMHALAQDVYVQRADEIAAQGGRAPELVVVAALGIEADYQAGRTDPVPERLDVMRKVEAAAFLAALDDDHATWMFDTLFLQGADGGEGAKDGVTIISASPSIQFAVPDYRLPRFQAVDPPAELRLLVVVPVEQDDIVSRARDFDEEQWRSPREAHDLCLHPGDRLLPAPLLEEAHRAFHVTVLFPLGIEDRRLVRYPDIVGKRGYYRLVPLTSDEFSCLFPIHFL